MFEKDPTSPLSIQGIANGKFTPDEIKSYSNEKTLKIPKDSGFSINFMDFSNYDAAWRTAELISKAKCIPREFQGNPADVLVVVQFGYELGLNPMIAIQNMMIVNNRPAIWGDAMLALCMRTKGQKFGFIDCIETYDEDKKHWTCTSIRDGREPVIRTFTMEDAKLGGLLEKPGSWQTNRKRMMQCRTRGFSLRDTYPDILKGIFSIEEASDDLIQDQDNKNSYTAKSIVDSMKDRLKSKISIEHKEIGENND